MMKKGFFVIGSTILLACSGCSQASILGHAEAGPDVVESKLILAADSISESLNDLAAIESANTPQSGLPRPKNAEALGMGARASLNWTGPVEPLLVKLARASNYTVHVLGHRPAMATIVSVRAKDASLASILRDARFQAQKSAEIVVYPNTKVIELRYLAG